MADMTSRVVLNLDKLYEIERRAPGNAAKVVQKMAQDCEADIKNSFSDQSPSDPWEPPGVDTGNLKNQVVALRGDNDWHWIVTDGTEYGVLLEYGTEKMIPRPFFRPAFERAAARIPKDLAAKVVFGG